MVDTGDIIYKPSEIKRLMKKSFINENDIRPENTVVKSICDSEKFCSTQGKITFGQLRSIVDSATKKRLFQHIGEGGFKATLRLLPWFLPQLAIAGFTGSIIRAVNKILRPTLEETKNYKTWWGKVVMKIFDIGEGELNISDPLSRVFFISDGLMNLMDNKYKVKFARYIAELASTMSDDEEVPEFFVENELRHWINDKFLLDPPLKPKRIGNEPDNIEESLLPFKQIIKNGYKYRTFNESVGDDELKWHRDETDRKVTILESNNWLFQMDNQLPVTLNEGDVLLIPKGEYHRIIKGHGNLKIKVKDL